METKLSKLFFANIFVKIGSTSKWSVYYRAHFVIRNAELCDVFFRKSLLQIPIRNGKMSYWHCLAFRKWPIPGILLHDCQKLGVIAEVFPLEGAKVFNKIFFTILLNLSCNSHVDVGLIDTIQRFFSANSKQDIFYISCSDYATYRPIHCTALSLLMWNASGAIVASPSSGQPCRWASVL